MIRQLLGRLTTGRKQTVTLRWTEPPHPDRDADPWYRLFTAEKRRRKRAGGYRCARCGSAEKVELHHRIPYALQGGVDIRSLNLARGLTLDAASFPAWFHGPGNTEPLCDSCHDLAHAIPAPAWEAMAVWRADVPPPVALEKAR